MDKQQFAKTLKQLRQEEKDEARQKLRDIFATQDRPTVYTVLRHVSSSGMSRDISLFTVHEGRLWNVTYLAGKAIGETVRDRKGQWVIRVNGCGMDMGFHLVYELSCYVYAGQDRAGYVLSQEWA